MSAHSIGGATVMRRRILWFVGVLILLAATASFVSPLAIVGGARGAPGGPLSPLTPSIVAAGTVHARFDLSSPQGGPFPSNAFAVTDASQNTGLRVDLPKPDCAPRPSDRADVDGLTELDGFTRQPR